MGAMDVLITSRAVHTEQGLILATVHFQQFIHIPILNQYAEGLLQDLTLPSHYVGTWKGPMVTEMALVFDFCTKREKGNSWMRLQDYGAGHTHRSWTNNEGKPVNFPLPLQACPE